jgi:hypothetical protein
VAVLHCCIAVRSQGQDSQAAVQVQCDLGSQEESMGCAAAVSTSAVRLSALELLPAHLCKMHSTAKSSSAESALADTGRMLLVRDRPLGLRHGPMPPRGRFRGSSWVFDIYMHRHRKHSGKGEPGHTFCLCAQARGVQREEPRGCHPFRRQPCPPCVRRHGEYSRKDYEAVISRGTKGR